MQEPLLFESSQGPVERPVSGEEAGAPPILDFLGKPKTVELLHALAEKALRRGKDRPLDGDEFTRLPSHGKI